MLGTGQTLKDYCETFKAHPRPVRESNQIARMIPVDQPNKIQHPRGLLCVFPTPNVGNRANAQRSLSKGIPAQYANQTKLRA